MFSYGQSDVTRAREIIRAAWFKPRGDGFVFRAPKSWAFAHPTHYLVSPEQRDRIVETLVPDDVTSPLTKLTRVVAAVVIGLLVLTFISTPLLLLSPYNAAVEPLLLITSPALIAVAGLVIYLSRKLATQQTAALRPVLGDAPITTEKISSIEIFAAAKAAGSADAIRRHTRVTAATSLLMSGMLAYFAVRNWPTAGGILDHLLSIYFAGLSALTAAQCLIRVWHGWNSEAFDPATRLYAYTIRVSLAWSAAYVVIACTLAVLQVSGWIGSDYQGARARFERQAAGGDVQAVSRLASLYRQGQGVAQDYARSLALYERAGNAGDVAAMTWAGWQYEFGHGTAQDYNAATSWFTKAAERGDANAMFWLGRQYSMGLGVARDYAIARQWYEKSAEAGGAPSMQNLALLYQNGQGVPQDYEKARSWLEKAAAAGSASSMDQLGAFYINGWGIARDEATARAWYEKAALNGSQPGMQHLASMLDSAKGGPADPVKAADLLLKSARLGHEWSLTMLLKSNLQILSPATRIELKRQLKLAHFYNGSLDGSWDVDARQAAEAYIKSPA